MGRKAAPATAVVAEIVGVLRTPFATQGRSYKYNVNLKPARVTLVGADSSAMQAMR